MSRSSVVYESFSVVVKASGPKHDAFTSIRTDDRYIFPHSGIAGRRRLWSTSAAKHGDRLRHRHSGITANRSSTWEKNQPLYQLFPAPAAVIWTAFIPASAHSVSLNGFRSRQGNYIKLVRMIVFMTVKTSAGLIQAPRLA